uniref:Uncharacterized protein LOC100786276 n=1 Tax=Rhizophora mucronata TaxID=61149 RepID=A0A2P2JQV7_RHIMU
MVCMVLQLTTKFAFSPISTHRPDQEDRKWICV